MTAPTPANPAMTDNILFEHFATLATAPEGIPRLRELILQLAVQGKLGTQDAGDETASVLLKKIKAERKQLVNEGKLKRESIIPPVLEIESPYSIPKGWVWATLNDTFLDIRSGGTPSKNNPEFWDGDINWASVKDLKNWKYLESTQDKITKKGLDECRSKLIQPGSLIICVRMGLGKIAINKIPLAINQDLKAADLSKYIDIDYFYNFYRAQTVQGTGMTVDGIRQEQLLQMPIPLPPLAEQHRIVAKVDRLMALCDELEARQQQEQAGCLRLGTASLTALQNAESPEEFERQWAQVCEAFEVIFDCPENVGTLRQTILQLAVKGRLVRQEPGDEQAGTLVEKIRKEKERLVKVGKIGRTMLTPEIEPEEIPYIIPKKWIWTRLDHLTYISTGSTPSTSDCEYYIGGNIPWVTSSLTSQKLIFDVDTKITEKAVNDCSLKIYPKGTLLVALYGQGKTRGQVSELGIPATINQACSAIVFWDNNEPIKNYLKLVLTGNYEKIRSISAGGAQPNLNGDKIKRTLIPLPPLAEQHRIVARVDALMALCDELEARLKERSAVQGRLAGAVVKQAAG